MPLRPVGVLAVGVVGALEDEGAVGGGQVVAQAVSGGHSSALRDAIN